jgi:hypothetical protein
MQPIQELVELDIDIASDNVLHNFVSKTLS